MSEIWFTSDLHFGHMTIIEKAYRPFSTVDEMNQTLIDNWNAVVSPEDTVWILGDVVMGQFAENIHLLGELNGQKALVPGNHDRVHPAYPDDRPHKLAEFRELYERYVVILPLELTLGTENADIDVCHFPFDGDHTDEIRYPEYRPIDRGQYLLHGHGHGMWKMNDRQIDVGVDAWDYTPVHSSVVVGMIYDHMRASDV